MKDVTDQMMPVKIGQRHPEIPPAFDSINLTLAGIADTHNQDRHEPVVAVSLQPLFKIWLAGSVEWEKRALTNDCMAYGIYTGPDFPDGLPIFIFSAEGKAFVVKAPLSADRDTVQNLTAETVSNGIHFQLIERQSGIVQTIRTLGMSKTFGKALRQAWSADLSRHPVDLDQYVQFIQTADDQALWTAARKWIYNPNSHEFEEVRAPHSSSHKIGNYKDFASAREYVFGSPAESWVGKLDHKAWGKSKNLILYFSDVETGGKYCLSVFSSNDYKSRDGQFDFRNDAVVGDKLELKTVSAKSGASYIASAQKIASEEMEKESTSLQTTFAKAKATFNYSGGPVDQQMVEAAIDFMISIEPDPEKFAEECDRLGLDDAEQYENILKQNAAGVENAQAAMRRYALQIDPPTLRAMQDAFYEIVDSRKYRSSTMVASISRSSLSRAWKGINGWSP